MENILFFVFVFYGFVFFCITTIITWLLSKKFPTIWFYNKMIVGIFLIFTTPVFLGIIGQNYFDSLPNGKFTKNVGFYPTAAVRDLQVTSEISGDHTENNFLFSTDKETMNRILGKCFYEIPEVEAIENFSGNVYLKEFSGKPTTKYYEKPAHDVEETGCMGDFSDSYIAYDEETGKTYFQWNWNDF